MFISRQNLQHPDKYTTLQHTPRGNMPDIRNMTNITSPSCDCLNYEKVMKYIMTGAGLVFVTYIFFKYQSRSQQAQTSYLKPLKTSIDEINENVSGLKNQFNREYLQSSYKNFQPQQLKPVNKRLTIKDFENEDNTKMRRLIFGMNRGI